MGIIFFLCLLLSPGFSEEKPVPPTPPPGSVAPIIPALNAATPFSEWCSAFLSQGNTDSGLDSCLPVVFHGSPLKFDAVKPYHSTRATTDTIKWDGDAIFATADPRVALFYTYKRARGFNCGIDLINYTPPGKPVIYHLHGGSSRDEALDSLYGNSGVSESRAGYIYVLSKQFFYREKGLGTMECISRDRACNLWRLEINRRKEIDALEKSGNIRIMWSKEVGYQLPAYALPGQDMVHRLPCLCSWSPVNQFPLT